MDEDGRRKKYFCAKIEVETIEEKDIVRCSGKQDEPDGDISDRVVSDPYDWLGTLSGRNDGKRKKDKQEKEKQKMEKNR